MSIFTNIPSISQPKNIKKSLFKHQLVSIYNMEKMEKEQKITHLLL